LFKKIVLVILGFLVALASWLPLSAKETAKTEILWDTWGVPHITAPDERSLFAAFGWAQTHSHGNLLLKLYGQARGKAAEYWGFDQLASDQYVRMMGIPKRAEQWYQQQSPAMKTNLDSFAGGINRYIQQHPQEIQPELKAVLPITGVDVLAHVQRVIYFEFLTTPQSINAIKNQTLNDQPTPNSNAWAIAPKKSATGSSLLLANPHLPWSGLYRAFEAQLTAPGVNISGMTLVGMPVPAIGFNEDLGWSLTTNNPRNYTIYELTLQPGGYLWEGEVKPFEEQKQILKIRSQNGQEQVLEWVTQKSIQGMIISQQKDRAYALRIAGLERPGVVEQFWQMAKANHLSSFEKALRQLQLPMFNILYSDRGGNIAYWYNAIAPKRESGNWKSWGKIQPGDTRQTLWTEYLSYEDLPKLINPKSGWLQNSNDPPWTSTFPMELNPNNYADDLAGSSLTTAEDIFRTQRSLKMLLATPKMSLDQMIRDKFSSRLEMADRLLPLLIPAAKMLANPLGLEAAEVLKNWDRQANADSRGAVLFMLWVSTISPEKVFSKPWQVDKPLDTPTGLADINMALAVLEGVAAQIKLLYGSLDVSWGEVMKMKQGKYQLPASGAAGELGSFRVVEYLPTTDQRFQAYFGDSFIAAIAFTQPLQAQTLMVYGNASQPHSPHVGDQLPLYAKNQLKPAWRDPSDILNHLEKREVLSFRPF